MIYFVIRMKKVILVVLLVLFFVIGGMLVWDFSSDITGRAILDDYSYTKAICEGTFCQDYEVFCDGSEFVEMVPFDDAWVVHDDGWVDFRDDVELCLNR